MKIRTHILFAISLFLICISLHAQEIDPTSAQEYFDATAIKIFNFNSFAEKNKRTITEELSRLVTADAQLHPEFGLLPYDAPCKDCIELIDKRTSNTRYYVKNGTKGQKFYSQACESDLHYLNDKGEWITIDPRLYPVDGNPGVYAAPQQSDPTTLDMLHGFTTLQLSDNSMFRFNEGLIAYTTNDFISFDNIQFINRNNYTVGNEGALVQNAFNNIDQELIFGEARIKSNYTVKNISAIDTNAKFFVIEDAFTLPEGFTLHYDKYEGSKNDYGYWYGDLILENQYGIELARVDAPIIYDSNPTDTALSQHTHNFISYSIEQTGASCKLKMIIETNYLKDPARVFPVVIDPTVFGTTATWTGVTGTDDSPTFCTNTLSVPTPANATLTGASIYWEFVASGVACSPFCKLKYMQVRVGTACGYSPSAAGVWTCPLCNTSGIWLPTLVKTDAGVAALVTCNTPQCASYNITFTLYHNQYQCVTAGGCVTTCDYMQKFQVTIEGETVTATATVEGGTSTYTVVNCADQSGWLSVTTPNYGVPGYTYSWSPIGATYNPVYVTYPFGTTVYTVTITDACGITSTDNVTVINNCLVLPIELLSFTGYQTGEVNILDWKTASEEHNHQFIIERSPNGIDFESIGAVDGNGTTTSESDYTFTDSAPFPGTNYYRLKQVDDNGNISYSDMIALRSDIANISAIIINNQNPVSDLLNLTIMSTEAAASDLHIYDVAGQLVYSQPMALQEGNTSTSINIRHLPKGSYYITLKTPTGKTEAQFIK